MATNIRMYYNPYLRNLTLKSLVKDGEKEFTGRLKDELGDKYKERFLLEDDGSDLLSIISDTYNGETITIDFVSTDRHYEKFKDQSKKYEKITVEKSEEKRILSPEEINEKITNQIEALKKKGYVIDLNEINKIRDAEIPIVVVGSMSSGKSSFINALIGEELLPTSQNAETGVTCEIHNSRKLKGNLKDKISISYCIKGDNENNEKNNKVKEIVINCTKDDEIKDQKYLPDDLKRELLEINDPVKRINKVLKSYNNKEDDRQTDKSETLAEKKMVIYYPLYSDKIPGNVVFYDTPGGDSDSNKGDAVTLKNALKEQSKGFLIYVASQRADLDKAEALINTVQENTGNKLDLPNTIVICNKQEEEPEENNKKTTIEKEWGKRIIYTSSAIALGARKTNKDEWNEKSLNSVYRKNISCFSDPNDGIYVSLPEFCSFPKNRIVDVTSEKKRLEAEVDNDQSVKEKLMEFNSGIIMAEQEIEFIANELFPYNQCERARKELMRLLNELENSLKEKQTEKSKEKENKRKEFTKLYQAVMNDLNEVCEEFVKSSQEEFSNIYNKADYSYKIDADEKFAKEIKDKYIKKDVTEDEVKDGIFKEMNEELEQMRDKANNELEEFGKIKWIEFAKKCIMKIDGRADITNKEKDVFKEFFSYDKVSKKIDDEEKDKINKLDLRIPKWNKAVDDDNFFYKIGTWFGNLAKNLKLDLVDSRKAREVIAKNYRDIAMDFSKDLLELCIVKIEEGYKKVKENFADIGSEDKIICGICPKLEALNKKIKDLVNEIEKLEARREYISVQINGLNEIFE